ncbi:antibiotic biosynthesis monooxygenase family protein [Corynebacterium renale]|uniref:Heme-degrading monooxygenase HmoA n=1 Tax=Corynebacterium renale TaxID=1724 RepID=A0A2A9DM00_9CORY|nr:antibiotic biosynthesis monooxygenase [Corynebacterium renale]PFG27728.1 heme-degrading monooxygenase HmoA [Corynebacterium renale]SQI22174.1 antibiotic biosynthesis monooxygenase [Corynebacterium renale]
MSIVKINALTVPNGEAGKHLEERFGARLHSIDDQPGFEGFQLLRPVKGDDRYFVITWWKDQESYDGWVNGESFAKSHGHTGKDGQQRKPAASQSSLLEFDVVLDSREGQ